MEKLKSENLMTGNYLQKDGVVHQVLSISGSLTDKEKSIKKAATIRTDRSSEYMFLDHFEPILISKETIKRLGFNKLITSYTLDGFEDLNLDFLENGLCSLRFNGFEISKLNYIHELQNSYNCIKRKSLSFKKTKK